MLGTPKTVYFIRHGETAANAALRHERGDEPLLPRGREEARCVGEVLRDKRIKIVFSSGQPRARETAEIICATIGLSFKQQLVVLEELHRPSFLRGAPYFFSRASLAYLFGFFTGVGFGDERRAGAETLGAFKMRIHAALEALAARPEPAIAVVSHRGFMAGLTALLRYGGDAPLWRFTISLLGLFAVDNGEITTATFDGTRWRLVRLNEDKHLFKQK